ELLLGEVAALDVAELQHDLTDRLAFGDGLLGDLRGRLVPDQPVQRRHHGRRRLGVLLAALDVRRDAGDATVGEYTGRVRDQPDGLQQVTGDHRQHHVQLEGPRRARGGDRGVVADHLRADLQRRLRQYRVDLAGHDAGARLQVGQRDLGQAGTRAGAHPAQVVADLGEADRDGAQLAGQLDQTVAGAVRL